MSTPTSRAQPQRPQEQSRRDRYRPYQAPQGLVIGGRDDLRRDPLGGGIPRTDRGRLVHRSHRRCLNSTALNWIEAQRTGRAQRGR